MVLVSTDNCHIIECKLHNPKLINNRSADHSIFYYCGEMRIYYILCCKNRTKKVFLKHI